MATELNQLTDEALVAETKRAAVRERQATTGLLALLIEVERRSLHLMLGYSSMFVYCTRALQMSEQAAYSRITAARAARRFPAILERLAEGALTLSSVGILGPHLTDENADALLDAALHKSTRDVERLIAAAYPQPDIPASVRALPSSPLLDCRPTESPSAMPAPVMLAPPPISPRTIVAPIAPRRYLLKVTLDTETHEKLQRARALLRHAVPDGDIAEILGRALTLLVREAERTKWASSRRPRVSHESSVRSRQVPAAVKRAVWSRDEGRCAFVGPDGRCSETGFLEFHHVVPFSVGGRTDAQNLELRCRAHNQHEGVIAGVSVEATRRAPSS
jgi:hypothetical protein